jgi:hypothetical protein
VADERPLLPEAARSLANPTGKFDLNHTVQLRLIERFSRTDFDTLIYEVTVDDPGAYTRPWTATWALD